MKDLHSTPIYEFFKGKQSIFGFLFIIKILQDINTAY